MAKVEVDVTILAAAAVGLLTIIFVIMQMSKGSGGGVESADVKAANAKAAANKKKKQKKKTSKTKSNGAAPAPEPEPEPEEEEEEEPAPAPAPSKKKKKKKKAKAPEPKPEPEPESEPEPEPEPESEPVVEPEQPATTGKKKKKKKKKKNGATPAGDAAAAATTAAPTPTGDADSDEEDDIAQAARLLNSQKKSGWSTVPIKRDNGKNKAAASKILDGDSAPEIMINIGSDPSIIIGTGGSIIQNITTKSGAKLDILKNTPNPGENMVRITADSQDSVAMAMEMVQKIVDDEEKRIANSKSVTLSSADINGSDGVKAIIGRKGETIKDIQSKCSGVKLDANVEKGQVVVSGPKDKVDMAVKLCKIAVFGETQHTIPLKSRSAVNIVYGKDFATIRQIQTSSGAKLDIDRDTNVIKLSGKAEEVAAAKQAITSLLSRTQGISLEIKAADIGAVFGKAGANIRNIQNKTGAFVEVVQPTSGADAKCTIMGEPNAVTEAKKLIDKAIAREVDLKPGEVAETVQLAAGAPAVIGKGGSKIKELERTHTVQLNINGDTGVCQIVGKTKNVESARKEIEGIVKPIVAALEAEKKAAAAAESGDSGWKCDPVSDADGW